MSQWSIALAKKQLSKVIEQTALGPQIITNRGRIVAIVTSPNTKVHIATDKTGEQLLKRLERLKSQFGQGEELKVAPRSKEKLVNPFE